MTGTHSLALAKVRQLGPKPSPRRLRSKRTQQAGRPSPWLGIRERRSRQTSVPRTGGSETRAAPPAAGSAR
eukprot:15440452-Alexandrium_andersonii.AAC.1